jgi:hypothetical protein
LLLTLTGFQEKQTIIEKRLVALDKTTDKHLVAIEEKIKKDVE